MERESGGIRDVYIVDGSRTPFIKANCGPGPFSASDLAVAAGRALLLRQPIEPSSIDEVILGCVMPAPEEANIARVAALRLGCGKTVPAWTVQRNCASGMQAVVSAADDIAIGRAEIVLAGGTEAMSRAPLLFDVPFVAWLAAFTKSRGLGKAAAITKFRPAMLSPVISLLRGLTDPTVGLSMGQTAEILAERFSITRNEMDAFAHESHSKVIAGRLAGHFNEIETIYSPTSKFYSLDDGAREDSSMEALAKLKPVFDKPFGLVSAGNSAQVTDGAVMLLLASRDAVEKYHLPAICKVKETRWAGVDPAQMGLGPVHSMAELLKANSLKAQDIDYWEINEAFAAQVLAVLKAWPDRDYAKSELGLDEPFESIPQNRLNVDGGAVAIGHPVGASGARLILHLAKTLERNGARRGVASLCIGGGQGGATLLERD